MLWASDLGRAYEAGVRICTYAGTFALVAGFSSRKDDRELLRGITLGTLTVGAIGLSARYFPGIAPSDARDAAISGGRLGFPVGYWNALGSMVAIGLVGSIGMATNMHRAPRALWLSSIPPGMLVIYLCSSRGALAAVVLGAITIYGWDRRAARAIGCALPGLAAGVLLIVLASFEGAFRTTIGSHGGEQGLLMLAATLVACAAARAGSLAIESKVEALKPPRPPGRLLLGVGLAIIALLVIAAEPAKRIHEFDAAPGVATTQAEGAHLFSGSGSGRGQFWRAAINEFADAPLAGHGAGSYQEWWLEHATLAFNVKNAHSLVLETLGELGIAGGALLAGFFLAFFIPTLRRRASSMGERGTDAFLLAIVVVGTFSATIDWTWQLPAAFWPVIAGAALLAARSPATPRPANLLDNKGLAAIVGLGILGSTAGAVVVGQRLELSRSSSALSVGDLSSAASAASAAADLTPWDARPRLQRALVEERIGDYRSARDELRAATDRAPRDWEIWMVRSRVELLSGNLDASTRALLRARALNPGFPTLFHGGAAPSPVPNH